MKTSVIEHIAKDPIVVLRQSYLEICDGSIPAAIILSILEYWTNVKINAKIQVDIENTTRAKEGLEPIECNEWIYKTIAEFQSDSLGLLKSHDVKKGIKLLIQKGYVAKRTNPQYKWDKTLQYSLNVEAVNNALREVTYDQSIGYIYPIEKSQVTNREVTGNRTIPEITTEITQRNNIAQNQKTASEQNAKHNNKKVVFDDKTNEFIVPSELWDAWYEAYQLIDPQTEVDKAAAWVLSNPTRKKKDWARFLNNWLTKAQDKAERAKAYRDGVKW